MDIFGYRLIRAVLLLFVISLSMFSFIPQNRWTSKQAKEENTNSHVNKITQDQALNRKGIFEIDKKLDQRDKSEADVRSNVKNMIVWSQSPPGTQMGEKQVAAIRRVIKAKSNVLVWGLGNDSPFWHDTTQGKVIFIEPVGFWFNKIIKRNPYLEAYTVTYTTELKKSFDRYINNTELWSELDLSSQLPPVIRNTNWDVIIVDAPPGYEEGQPGRFQSIYTSSLLAQNGTHVFVDDYDRKVEREFSKKMLGEPIEVVSRPRNIFFGNQQAHFLHIKR